MISKLSRIATTTTKLLNKLQLQTHGFELHSTIALLFTVQNTLKSAYILLSYTLQIKSKPHSKIHKNYFIFLQDLYCN